jgi:uncharacterized protein (DUF983 family)
VLFDRFLKPPAAVPKVGADLPQMKVDKYRPASVRRRVLFAVGAVVVAWTVIPYMVRHWGIGRHLPAAAPTAVAVCAAGQSEGCVGGRVGVIVMPAEAASASTSASPRLPSAPR